MKKSPRRPNPLSLIALLLVLASCAVARPAASQALQARQGGYELQVMVDGRPVRTFAHDGETHVLAHAGDRYVLRIHNRTSRRIEAVVSVDGRDVIDGQPADFAAKRGYLVPPYGHVDIDGWRVSQGEAAAFRFGAVSESYAAKTGSARNVGVIGVAVFPERVVRPRPNLYVPSGPMSEQRSGAPAKGTTGGLGEHYRRAPAPAPELRAEREQSAPTASAQAPSAKAESSAADEAAPAEGRASRSRAGLGTEFGESVHSEIRHVSFVRANPRQPALILGARYNDREGLLALGIDVDAVYAEGKLRRSANPFPVSQRYAVPPADWRRD